MEQDRPLEDTPAVFAFAQEASASQTTPERLAELSAMPELRQLVAANMGAPAQLLEVLSEDESARVRLAVVQNPNTALPCLLKLAREFPEAFFLNPLCKLLDLADPGWYAQIDDETWLHLLRSEKIPPLWLKWVKEWKHGTPLHTQAMANGLADEAEVWVSARLHVTQPALHTNGEHIGRDMEKLIQLVCYHKRTPEPILAELAAIVCQYASLAEIGNAACELIPRVVAENVQAPEAVLRQLAQAEDPKVRYRVGQNPRTPLEVLERLMSDAVPYVKSGVVINSALPVSLLERFVEENGLLDAQQAPAQAEPLDESAGFSRMQKQEANNQKLIVGALAGAETTPDSILRRLSTHCDVSIRARLAANPAVSEDVLLSMLGDVDQVLVTLVEKNPHVPVQALIELAGHKNSKIRIAVAKHPRTPGEVLELLAGDSHVRVREAVAKHPCTPLTVLERLAQEGESAGAAATAVRAAVAVNPVTPRKVLADLAKQGNRDINRALARNPSLPPDLIECLLMDKDPSVCLQIASHPHLSQEELLLLTRHPAQPVAELAQQRLDLWRKLGSRGGSQYLYQFNPYGHVPLRMGEGVLVSMPFYEIQRRTQAMLKSGALLDFLNGCQLSAAERQEIFEALLPELNRKWQRYPGVWMRLFAVFDLPPAWQRILAAAPRWQMRYAVAVKPEVETAVLEMLADDGNRYVRAAARWYLRERQAG